MGGDKVDGLFIMHYGGVELFRTAETTVLFQFVIGRFNQTEFQVVLDFV